MRDKNYLTLWRYSLLCRANSVQKKYETRMYQSLCLHYFLTTISFNNSEEPLLKVSFYASTGLLNQHTTH